MSFEFDILFDLSRRVALLEVFICLLAAVPGWHILLLVLLLLLMLLFVVVNYGVPTTNM